jgi:hypothetical protein
MSISIDTAALLVNIQAWFNILFPIGIISGAITSALILINYLRVIIVDGFSQSTGKAERSRNVDDWNFDLGD